MKEKENACPECKSTDIRYDPSRGETVCSECGLVIDQIALDTTQEWRAFDEGQRSRRVRTGPPLKITKHDRGITTEMGKGAGELFKVDTKKRAQYYRLTKWQKRLIKSKDRNLSNAFVELQRATSQLNLSKTMQERVAALYEKTVDKSLVRGRPMEAIIAALIYIVCREERAPRTLEEISTIFEMQKRDIGKTYRYIARKLEIKIQPPRAKDYIPRFGTLIGVNEKVQVNALRIADKVKEHITSGKGPVGIAAAILYIASVLEGQRKTQREIADAIKVTEVTIRNRYKEIADALGIRDTLEEMANDYS